LLVIITQRALRLMHEHPLVRHHPPVSDRR
jgi:hypothetical protein